MGLKEFFGGLVTGGDGGDVRDAYADGQAAIERRAQQLADLREALRKAEEYAAAVKAGAQERLPGANPDDVVQSLRVQIEELERPLSDDEFKEKF